MNGAALPGSFPQDVVERVLSPPRRRRTPVLVRAPTVFWRGEDSVPVLRHARSSLSCVSYATGSSLAPPSPMPHVPSIYERDIRSHPIPLSPVSEVSRGFSGCSLSPSVLNLDTDIEVSEVGTAAQQSIVVVDHVDYSAIPEPRETVADGARSREAVDLHRSHPYDQTPFVPLQDPSHTVADEDFCFRAHEPRRKLACKGKLAMRWSRCKLMVRRYVERTRPVQKKGEEVTSSGDKARYAVEKVKDRLRGQIVDRMGWRAVF